MKNTFVFIALLLIFVINSGAEKTVCASSAHHKKNMKDVQHTHKDIKSTDTLKQGMTELNNDSKTSASIQKIVDNYIQLKNALVNDNSKDAAASSKKIVAAMEKLNKHLLTPDQKKLYEDVEENAIENAEHIGDNAGNIDHQREHFDILSIDVYDLVKEFGGGQMLYKNFCPMYNDKRGAIWLSETKEIKNPYYGKKMLTCGSIKEEIK